MKTIWTLDHKTCTLAELKNLLTYTVGKVTLARAAHKVHTPADLELHIIHNWCRARLGEPGAPFKGGL